MKRSFSIFLLVFLLGMGTGCKKSEPAKMAVVTTAAVHDITPTTAKSGGNITSDGGAPITAKGVCWSLAANPSTTDLKTNNGTSAVQFESLITGLTAGATYHIRAYATNSAGTAYGSDLSFTALGKAPSSVTLDATNVTEATATLNGSVNANEITTTAIFEYGPTTSYGSSVPAAQVTGNTVTPVSAGISGLTPGTTYHFRIKTENVLGTTYGSDLSFVTLGQLPVCTTLDATDLASDGATLNGTANANELSTAVSFEYGTDLSYGSTATAVPGTITGNTDNNVSLSLTGLAPGTTYHFRVKAVNALGTANGEDKTFTTLGQIPSCTTLSATNITTTNATLNGSVNANELSATVAFEYGTTTGYGGSAPAVQNPVTGNTVTQVNSQITGLTAGLIYHFRIKAVNSLGTTYGNDMTFVFTLTDADANIYPVITIGTRVWMKENLRTTKFQNGEAIAESFAYNNDNTNAATYGRLYTWYVVNDGRKLCPAGWHVPTEIEWSATTALVASAAELKESGTAHWQAPNTGATNSIGFTALPGGYYTGLSFVYLYQQACFWLGDQVNASLGRGAALYYNNLPTAGDMLSWPKARALSVRCIKN